MNTKLLWALQGPLAALYLFAGIFKLIQPAQALEPQAHMSGLFSSSSASARPSARRD